MKIAIYPGSFDPFTYGHEDLVKRASSVFQKLIVAILDNPKKKILFSLEDRILMTQEALKKYRNVLIMSFNGLLINFLKEVDAKIVIRGIRNSIDFEYEYQMAAMNKYLFPNIEVLFLFSSDQYRSISSKFVKEIAYFGGDVSQFVCPSIEKSLIIKFKK